MSYIAGENIYPLTVVRDRYEGKYSGGCFLAFNEFSWNVPEEIDSDDASCCLFWNSDRSKEFLVGKGVDAVAAILDLENQILRREKVQKVIDGLPISEFIKLQCCRDCKSCKRFDTASCELNKNKGV